MANHDTLDVIVAIAQIISVIFLIIYVIKTWQMASASKRQIEISANTLIEMKEARLQEIVPRVVVYFEIPYGEFRIYLIVKNIGKSIAKDIKLNFNPALRNADGEIINEIPLIKDGIKSMPPEFEIRTIFDSVFRFFGRQDLPLSYEVGVSYLSDYNSHAIVHSQIIDLSPYKGLQWAEEKGLKNLIDPIKKIAENSEKISATLAKFKH